MYTYLFEYKLKIFRNAPGIYLISAHQILWLCYAPFAPKSINFIDKALWKDISIFKTKKNGKNFAQSEVVSRENWNHHESCLHVAASNSLIYGQKKCF